MGFQALECWTLICDEPGCGADVMEDAEYSGWGDKGLLEDEADSAEWRKIDGKWYCEEHASTKQTMTGTVLVQNFDPTGLPPTLAELVDGEWAVLGVLRGDVEPLKFYYPAGEEPPC